MEAHHFDWRSLGKPDYAQASALVSSLPEDIRCKISGATREVLTRIIHLTWLRAVHGGRGSAYCWPSERYLASVCKRSERSVRRYITILRGLKLLNWRHRVNKLKAWTSNLYLMGNAFLATLYAKAANKVQRIQARTKMSDNDLKGEYKADVAPTVQPFIVQSRETMSELVQKVLDGTSGQLSRTVQNEDKRIEARKQLLKQQLEHLKARGL